MQKKKIDPNILKTRVRLLSRSQWFGSMAHYLELVEDRSVKTMWTDGTTLAINPEFWKDIPQVERDGLMCVKIFQAAMRHPYRMKNRDPKIWSEASRKLAEAEVTATGIFSLPEACEVDMSFLGKSVEEAYAYLRSQQEQGGGGQQGGQSGSNGSEGEGDSEGEDQDSDGGGSSSPSGDVRPPQSENESESDDKENQDGEGEDQGKGKDGKDGQDKKDNNQGGEGKPKKEPQMTEIKWAVAAEQATMLAQKAGTGSGNLEQAVKASRDAEVDFEDFLRKFISKTIPTDTSWCPPNRRLVSQGYYLPGPKSETCPPMVIFVDTSGSVYCSPNTLSDFSSVTNRLIRDFKPEKVHIVYIDDSVQKIVEIDPATMTEDFEMLALGGGGTAFQPGFDYVAENFETQPACAIYLTDLEGDHPSPPEYPVVWVTPAWVKKEGLFGDTVRINP